MARRIAAAIVVVAAFLGLDVSPSSAKFTAQTSGTRLSVSTSWVGPPTVGAPSMSGLTETLAGSKGTNADGWRVGTYPSTTSSCASASYSYNAAGSTQFSKTFSPGDNGKWACLDPQSTWAGWTSVNNPSVSTLRMGLVVNSAVMAPAGSGCVIANVATCGATITLKFNQDVDNSTVTGLSGETVCFIKNGNIVIADSSPSNGSCKNTDSADVGVIVSPGVSATQRVTATYNLTDVRTLVVRLTTLTGLPSVSGSGTLNPSAAALKSTGSTPAPLCASATAPDCTVTATGSI